VRAEAERLQEEFSSLPLLEAVIRYLALQVEGNQEMELQPSATRDIVVLSGPLDDPAERAMLSWALMTGAAVVLEPNPVQRVATAAWIRPTVFHGTPEEIAALHQWVEKARQRWWRRLRAVLVKGAQGLPDSEEAFWRQRGVEIGRI
jgi:hypothetical protein